MTITIEEILPIAQKAARIRTTGRPSDRDDAVQEGMIAAWTAMERHPDKRPSYYAGAAQMGVLGYVTDEHRPTGAPSRRGGGRKQNDVEMIPIVGWDAPLPENEPPDDRVRRAVASLDEDDREIVFMKIWLDMTWRQIGERLGRNYSTISVRWTKHIAPKLREALDES